MDINIVYHPSGDWEGLYIDGSLVDEGHSRMKSRALEILAERGIINLSSGDWKVEKQKYVDAYGEYEEYPSSMPVELPETV